MAERAASESREQEPPGIFLGSAFARLVPRWLWSPFSQEAPDVVADDTPVANPGRTSPALQDARADGQSLGSGRPPETPSSERQQQVSDLSDPVEASSLKIAEARASESLLPPEERLFEDYLAAAVCSTFSHRLARKSPRIAIRTKYFDDFFSNAVTSGIEQIVILGTGMDSRAYRIDALREARVVVYDVDTPNVLRLKAKIIKSMRPPLERLATKVVPVEGDVAKPGWVASLVSAGFNENCPSAWILEGLVYYIEEGAVEAMLRSVRALACPGSLMCASIVGDGITNEGGVWSKSSSNKRHSDGLGPHVAEENALEKVLSGNDAQQASAQWKGLEPSISHGRGDAGESVLTSHSENTVAESSLLRPLQEDVGSTPLTSTFEKRPENNEVCDEPSTERPVTKMRSSTNEESQANSSQPMSLRGLSSFFVFRCSKPREFLTRLQFDVKMVACLGSAAAHYGRWPSDLEPSRTTAYVTFTPRPEAV